MYTKIIVFVVDIPEKYIGYSAIASPRSFLLLLLHKAYLATD